MEMQYQQNFVNRELHKAFVGFSIKNGDSNIPIATGHWGCGAFNGDPELKFLIQWMAASQAKRLGVLYHTMGNVAQSQRIKGMADIIIKKRVSVGKLYKLVIGYQSNRSRSPSIFDYAQMEIRKSR